MEPVTKPTIVTYTGLYADDHLVDIQELGRSLTGLGRVANSVTHFWLYGEIVKDSRLFRVKHYAGPPQENGVLYEIAALMAHGQLPIFAPLLCDLAGSILPHLWQAIFANATRRNSEMDKALDIIHDQIVRHDEFARSVHDGHMVDKKWLQEHVNKLTDVNRRPMMEIPAPVGKSCEKETIWAKSASPTEIDEPTAQVLRSKEPLKVGDVTTYEAMFEAVDTTNGSCKLITGDGGRQIKGKITDPILSTPENVYTHALDTKQTVILTGKPVVKDGQIVQVYISDARPK